MNVLSVAEINQVSGGYVYSYDAAAAVIASLIAQGYYGPDNLTQAGLNIRYRQYMQEQQALGVPRGQAHADFWML